jgi:hypothetical protein
MKLRYSAILGTVLLLLCFGWILGTASSFNTCKAKQTTAQSEKATDNSPLLALAVVDNTAVSARCALHMIYEYRDATTAIATIFIALFTFTLWWSTMKMMRATKDAVDLARQEFTATHRPKIIVHGMEVKLPGDERRHVHFRYVNAGDTDAFITSIVSRILWTAKSMVPADIEFSRHDVIKEPILVPSGKNGFAITPDGVDFVTLVRSGRGGHDTAFCVGVVVYRDTNDIERRTGFCRRYDSERERWLKVEDEDYEYAY